MRKKINLPKVKKIGKECFYRNECAKTISLKTVEEIGNYFFEHNNYISKLNVKKLNYIKLNTEIEHIKEWLENNITMNGIKK